jgi:hypothetical protein
MSVSVVHAQPTVTWTRALAGAGPGLMAMLIMMLVASVLIAERAIPSTDNNLHIQGLLLALGGTGVGFACVYVPIFESHMWEFNHDLTTI